MLSILNIEHPTEIPANLGVLDSDFGLPLNKYYALH